MFVNVSCQQFNQIDEGADFLKVLPSVDPNAYENPELIPHLSEIENRDGEPGDTDGAYIGLNDVVELELDAFVFVGSTLL